MQRTTVEPYKDERTLATINVRMPASLKTGGEAVLEREGLSVSEAIRRFYEYLEKQQTLPDCVRHSNEDPPSTRITKKRDLLKSLTGILPSDISLEQIRDERLSKHLRTGTL